MQTKNCYILLLVFFVLSIKNNFAQQNIDSVQQIETVNIIENKKNQQSTFLIDAYQSQNDISEALQQQSNVQINSYGLGNSSSISIRGANDDHTNVFWNGLKINSMTLGGTDFSLIPFESGDEIYIETSNSSFGGNLRINAKPNWLNKINLKYRSDIGSFDNYRNAFSFKTGNKKIQFHTSTYYQRAKYNFSYVDVYKFENPIDTINHNTLKSIGTVNTIFFQLKKQIFISAGSWFQKKDKELPSIMGSNEQSSKFQKDRSVRHFINLDKTISKGDFHFSIAHTFDEMNYTDKRMPTDTFLFINSNYKTNRISNLFLINNNLKYNLSLQSGYMYNVNLANVKEYVKSVSDHIGEVYSHIKWENRQFGASLRLTQPFSSFKYVRPQFYADAGFKSKNQHKQYSINISYSDKYRFPDLNDRYWNPGGNPNLKPEFGWTINLSNQFEAQKNNHTFTSNVHLYYSKIRNNIVWTPITNVLWTPQNLKSTQLYGIESNTTYTYKRNDRFYIQVRTIYNFNRTQIIDDANNKDLKGNFLRYKPQHILKSNFYIEQKYVGIGANYIYTSSRFTDEENFEFFALKPYHLLDVFLTFKGIIREHHAFQFIFKINNVTNTSYESVRSYAQPLRNYSISFIYNFSKLQNNSQ